MRTQIGVSPTHCLINLEQDGHLNTVLVWLQLPEKGLERFFPEGAVIAAKIQNGWAVGQLTKVWNMTIGLLRSSVPLSTTT